MHIQIEFLDAQSGQSVAVFNAYAAEATSQLFGGGWEKGTTTGS